MTIAPCGRIDPHEHHVWTPEPRAVHGPKRCPGVVARIPAGDFAEEAEYHVEQLRDARDIAERKIERACEVLDGWEHDGPKEYEFHLLILRVREALDGAGRPCRRCGCGVDGDGKCPCGCDEPNRTQMPASVHDSCHACGHRHTPDGCVGPPSPSDAWAGVSPAVCDCDAMGGGA